MSLFKRDNPLLSIVILCVSVLVFGVLMLRGLSEAKAKGADLSVQSVAVAKADVYWIEVEELSAAPTPEPQPVECACNGSRLSGDNLSPCPCIANGGNCTCARGAEPISAEFPYKGPLIDDKYHLQVKSHPACIPCVNWKKVELPILEKRGVKVQFIDVPFENVPRFVYANDPKKINHVGYVKADDVIKKLLD
jgi:hypothetical protein